MPNVKTGWRPPTSSRWPSGSIAAAPTMPPLLRLRRLPNPSWTEWLMGFPLLWTDLQSSETPLSLKSPNSSDEPLSPTSNT